MAPHKEEFFDLVKRYNEPDDDMLSLSTKVLIVDHDNVPRQLTPALKKVVIDKINEGRKLFANSFLTHLCLKLIGVPTLVSWMNLFRIQMLLGSQFQFHSNFKITFCSVVSDLALPCLSTSHKNDTKHIT